MRYLIVKSLRCIVAKYEIFYDHDLKDFNTFKIGGKAKYIVIVYNNETLYRVCNDCVTHNIKYKVIGLGANLLFDDNGYNGAIIINKCDEIHVYNNYIVADSGATIASLIDIAYKDSLSGLEKFAGIPSTLGGAIANNLGSNGEISEYIQSVECFAYNNPKEKIIMNNSECHFAYRDSIFKSQEYVIVSARLRLTPDIPQSIKERTIEYLHKKLSTQPLDKRSAGSVFKRSDLIPSKIIDDLKLKGYSIGGAQVSTKHAGFIINAGNASSHDVLALIDYINSIVYTHYGKKFLTEIEYVGDKN